MRETTLRMADRGILAMLAATLAVFAIFGMTWFAYTADSNRDPTLDPTKAFAHMRHLAGANATACGQVAIGTDPRAAMACARQAMQEGRPFWVAKEHLREGLWWYGLVRTAQGRVYFVAYDHNGGGRVDRHPALFTSRCRDPQLAVEGWTCAR